jgi:hybrid cluster-associated redox disulfide protein
MGKKASKKVSDTPKPKLSVRTTVGRALELHPKAAAVFEKYGMSCARCHGAQAEPIEKAADLFGADPRAIVRELNKLLSGG